jgi:acyl carrier protein
VKEIIMFEIVKEVIIDILSCSEDKITLESDLFKDLGADSLDAVELSLAVEEKTGITIDQDALPELKTVQDIVDYLEAHK